MSYVSRVAEINRFDFVKLIISDYNEHRFGHAPTGACRILIVSDAWGPTDDIVEVVGQEDRCLVSCSSLEQYCDQAINHSFDVIILADGLSTESNNGIGSIMSLLSVSGLVYVVASSELSSAGRVIFGKHKGDNCSNRLSAEQTYHYLSSAFLIDTQTVPLGISIDTTAFTIADFYKTNFDPQKVARIATEETFLSSLKVQCKGGLTEQFVILRCFSNIDALASIRVFQNETNVWDYCERDISSLRGELGFSYSYREAVEVAARKLLYFSSHNHNTMFSFADGGQWVFKHEMKAFVDVLRKSKAIGSDVTWKEVLIALLFSATKYSDLRNLFPIFVDEEQLNIATTASFSIKIADAKEDAGVYGTTIRLPKQFNEYKRPIVVLGQHFASELEQVRTNIIENKSQDFNILKHIHEMVYAQYVRDTAIDWCRCALDQAWVFYCALFDGKPSIPDKDLFCYVLYWRGLYLSGTKDVFIYYPHWSKQQGKAIFAISNFCKSEYVKTYFDVYSQYGRWLDVVYLMHTVRSAQTKSAIGSIMSRNGSHNIGSHVLAALSHNVGTMPDDRVLYQYIQHRMDYIATATTERPTWTMPTKFVSSMMRRFLSQRHLLDYISRSEGLTAYQFQNPQEDTSTLECQPGTIRLRVRRIAEDDALWNRKNLFAHARPVEDFIDYPKGTTSRLDRDIEVAIPVGVVGQHAFFTILENILRNAAKHEWSVAQTDAIDSAGEYAPTVDKEKPQRPVRASHLDVYVDFQDRPQNGKVDVVVWSDCGGRNFVEKACYLSPAKISARLESETSSGGLELNDLSPLQQLQVKMARPFIAADGHLHRENWGLAEMRISAGYLNLSKIDDIGGIGQSRTRFDIISPVVVESESPAPGQSEKHRCLGYKFSIPKPKELLVILPDSMIRRGEGDRIKATVEAFSAGLKRFGVELVFESTLETRSGSDAALPFSYVLFSGKPTVLEKLKLGYRLLGAPNASAWTGAQYTGRLFEENLDDLLKSEPEQFVNDLLNDVYGDWMRFVKSSYRKKKGFSDDTEFPLVIDIFGEQSKDDRAERSLISDAELLDFIFRNTFNSAVDSYRDRIDPLDELSIFDETVDRGLMVWRAPGARKVHIEATRPVFKNGVKVPDKFVKLSRSAMIRRQLENWCTRQYDDPDDRECMRKMKSWLEALDKTENASAVPEELTDFISYLEKVIVEQAKAFLSKYEERIVTLPTSMEIKCPPDNSRANDNPEKQVGGQRVIFTSSDDFKNSLEHAIAYWRHEDYKVERKNAPVYREALSGAQSYFSVFQELELAISGGSGRKPSRQEVGIVAKLVECGLFQVLIVDERVSRFVAEHQDVKDAFSHIGIDVWDADFHQTTAMFRKQDPVLPEGYDIAIVHQGVIDKRLRDDEALTSVNDFCDRMKQKVPYFAITTGRGTPSTIPPGARVLPFSVIESTLFTRYPEKFILVDTIMNLLPVGRQEEQ